MFYRIKVGGQWREIDLRPLAEVPGDVIANAQPDGLIWDVFAWGMVDPMQMMVLDQTPMRLIRGLWHEWQQDSSIQVNDIRQLLDLIDKHSEALEADLIDKGLRLRDCPSPQFNWRDLWVLVRYSGRNSNIVGASNPDLAGWDKQSMLQAQACDALNWLVWAQTEDAAKGNDPPDLIVRPGVKPKEIRPGSKTKPRPISEIRQLAGLDPSADEIERSKKIAAAFRR
jgi:hypothetical protein